jgi:hypothetical protein
MLFVAPDILADACGLSVGLILATALLGCALWLFGWWSHRFWVVLLTTVLAGVYGLYEAPAFRTQPIIASVLLAVAAGMLALALVRMLAFLTGGLAGLLLVHGLFPSLNQPLICFVTCGLLCLFLFRLCMMALTGFAGALLLCYAGLMVLNHYGALDVVAWAEESWLLLNGICGGLAFVGAAFQFLLDREMNRRARDEERDREDGWAVLTGWGWGKLSRRAA